MSPVDPKVNLRGYILEGQDGRKFARENPELNKRLTAASSSIRRANTTAKRLQAQKTALGNENRKLKRELSNLERSDLFKNKVAAVVESKEAEFAKKTTTLQVNFDKQLAKIEKTKNAGIAARDKTIEAKDQEITSLRGETQGLRSSLENIDKHPVYKKTVTELTKNISNLNKENLRLVAQLNNVESFPEFNRRLEEAQVENNRKIADLEAKNNTLKANTVKLQTAMSNLDKNPVVKNMLAKREKELQLTIKQQSTEIVSLRADNIRLLAELKIHGASEEITQENFSSFISKTLRDLGDKMEAEASPADESKFVIKEVEIDTKLLMEKKNNQAVYILPTADKLKDISPDALQSFKFVIKSVPRF